MNITEDYVSEEVAKLLQIKGFDEPCDSYYERFESGVTLYKGYMPEFYHGRYKPVSDMLHLKRPTHQMALKWLREEKGIYLDVFIDDDSEMPWTYNIHKELMDGTTECICHHHGNYYPLRTGYEQAVEAAIKYTLENLI